VSLKGAKELFGLCQGQPEMLDTSVVLVEGDHIGDGLFMTLIAAHDELKFDTHTGASPGSSDRWIAQAILPEFRSYPQHLPALTAHRPAPIPTASTMARIKRGKAMPISSRRWLSISNLPPTYALATPQKAPTVVPSTTARIDTAKETRPP
jgi:hypothetical protein